MLRPGVLSFFLLILGATAAKADDPIHLALPLHEMARPSTVPGPACPLREPRADEEWAMVDLGSLPNRSKAQPAEVTARAPGLLASFQAAADDGVRLPPDTMGAVGPTHVLTTLNGEIRVHTKGGIVVSEVSMDDFWAPVNAFQTSNPKCLYDPLSDRWFLTANDAERSPDSSLLLAVSLTGDPTGSWILRRYDADPTGATWVDHPSIGLNQRWVAVTGNMFSVRDDDYQGPRMWVWYKGNLLSPIPVRPATLPTGFTGGATLFPVLTFDPGEPSLYIVQSGYEDSTYSYLHVSRLFGPDTQPNWGPLDSPHGPGYVRIPKFSYTLPGAPQADSNFTVETGQGRIGNAVFRNGHLWCTHAGGIPWNTPVRTAVDWHQVNPEGPASAVQDGRIDGGPGTFYFYPSLTVNSRGDAAFGFSGSSSGSYVSAYYTARASGDGPGSTQPVSLLKAGQAPYYKLDPLGRNRWGDYSHTVVDGADDTTFWTIQEYAELSLGGQDRWGTWWGGFQVSLPFTPTQTPTRTVTPSPTRAPFATETPTQTPSGAPTFTSSATPTAPPPGCSDDPFEPNDSCQEAALIDPGFHSGLRVCWTGEDLYAVAGQAGLRLKVVTRWSSGQGSLVSSLVSEDCLAFIVSDFATGGRNQLEMDCWEDVNVRLQILTSATNAIAYDLNLHFGPIPPTSTPTPTRTQTPTASQTPTPSLTPTPTSRCPPNASVLVPDGHTATGSLPVYGSVDFRIDIPENGMLNLRGCSALRYKVWEAGDDCVTMKCNTLASCDICSPPTFPVTAGQVYYVNISTGSSAANFTLTATFSTPTPTPIPTGPFSTPTFTPTPTRTPTGPTATPTPNSPNTNTPTLTPAPTSLCPRNAVPLLPDGRTETGSLPVYGSVDFRIDIPGDGTLNLRGCSSLRYKVWEAGDGCAAMICNALASCDICSPPTFPVTAGQVYYVNISTGSSAANYQLTASFLAPTLTPAPTDPLPTSTPTPAPIPRVLAAGYFGTALTSSGGGLILWAVGGDYPLGETLEIFAGGASSGARLSRSGDVYSFSTTLPPPLPKGRFLLELGWSGRVHWPYLRVE